MSDGPSILKSIQKIKANAATTGNKNVGILIGIKINGLEIERLQPVAVREAVDEISEAKDLFGLYDTLDSEKLKLSFMSHLKGLLLTEPERLPAAVDFYKLLETYGEKTKLFPTLIKVQYATGGMQSALNLLKSAESPDEIESGLRAFAIPNNRPLSDEEEALLRSVVLNLPADKQDMWKVMLNLK